VFAKAVIGFWTLMTSVMVTKINGTIKRADAVKCSVFITTKKTLSDKLYMYF
jgi:hypothetical protein